MITFIIISQFNQFNYYIIINNQNNELKTRN